MLAEARFLWRHRERPSNVARWLTVWGKRLLLAIPLCSILLKATLLRLGGAKIGAMVVVGRAKIEGARRYLTIGDETSLGRCQISLHDRVDLGRRVVINDGAVLLTASHDLRDSHWGHRKRPIRIADYAWVATNAMILPGVSIGRGAVVGAGAVVTADVPDYAVVSGNPATIQSSRRAEQLNYSPVLLNAPLEAWIGRDLPAVLRLTETTA